MKRRSFFSLAGVGLASALVPKAFAGEPKVNVSNKKDLANPFAAKGKWYKAALHVHTTNSDGDVDVPTRIQQYRDKGFDIVAITDHRKTNDLSGFSVPGFMALSSIEFHPKTYSGAPTHHFLGLGLPHPYEYNNDLPAQEMINDIKSKGAKVFYAHPYWTGHTYEEMTEVNGYLGVEVYNQSCEENDSAYGNVYWDQMLNKGHVLSGLATDDVHQSSEVGKAWTMIKAEKLDESSILDALENGCFYASSGPEIKDFQLGEDMKIKIECSSVKKIAFRIDGAGNGRVFHAQEGEDLQSAEWDLSKKKPRWVRCEVSDENGKTAWTNPIFLKS
ncbi:PHP domain-containing protein [Maribellus luteus]|uniref:PHP domain-containing protein n=1 Tax=Maribellus luteus TaxID=2305463 RepID=A0A399T6E9_9BACT|nr:CehA/McbA family metallohydrolase [Maribellus luteus]RIJ50372.1 PHP domain-containing protein [Maribellus luteus]